MAYLALTSDLIFSERHAQHSHLTSSCENGSALISDHVQAHHIGKALNLHPTSSCWKGSIVTSDPILLERNNTHIWPCVNTSRQNGSSLTSDLILSERVCTYIRPCVNTSHRKGSQSQTELLGNWPGASIPIMAVSLTSVLLDRMANTHIWHGRNLII